MLPGDRSRKIENSGVYGTQKNVFLAATLYCIMLQPKIHFMNILVEGQEREKAD